MDNFNYDKIYFEIYALLSMELLYADFSTHFCKGENPDWQNEEDEIGFEVTRAENPHIGYTKKLANTYLGKSEANIPQSVIKNFQGQLSFEKGRLFAISDSNGLVDGTRHIEFAIDTLKTKTQLLNKPHFRVFDKNYLYIFLTNTVIGTDFDLFRDRYQCQNKYVRNYDSVILFDNSALHLMEISEKEYSKLEIDDHDLHNLKLMAKKLRNLDFWANGTSFQSVAGKL